MRVTRENWLAVNNYAVALMEQGRDDEALGHPERGGRARIPTR